MAALSAAAALASGPVAAQLTDSLVITGSREPLQRHLLAADVVVIDAARIRNSAADSLEDLLRREAGLQVLRNGAPGQSAGLSIRGGARGQTLVLVDGVRVGSATLGTPELDSLSLAGVERIEVLRGPGSSLYGADALGGVVQIFTRRGSGEPRAAVRLAAGSFGAREASLDGTGRWGALDAAVGLSTERLRGTSTVRPNDSFGVFNSDADGMSRHSEHASFGLALAPQQRLSLTLRHARLGTQFDSADYPPPNFDTPDPSPDFRTRGVTQLGALQYRGQFGADWTLSAQASEDRSDMRSGADASFSGWSNFGNRRRQTQAQASWQATPQHLLTLALEHLEEQVHTDQYAVPGTRRNDAAVLAYAGTLSLAQMPIQVQADLRHDRNSVYGGVDTGRLGVKLPLGGGWSARALWGTAFRGPAFNDLYYPFYGVPTLRPERARSAEVGAAWASTHAEVALTAWQQRVRDLVAYQPDVAACPVGFSFGCAANVGRANLQGLSLAASGHWQAWHGRLALESLSAKDAATGDTLARRARQQASGGLEWQQRAWSTGAEFVHVGRRPDISRTLGAYTTLDLLARWRPAPQWELQFKLLNATDKDVEPLQDYQGLGRQAWLVLRWEGGL